MMKRTLTLTMLLLSMISWAELPSWGMTENQYKLPNFNSKMKEIGSEASKNNWLLKITAPKDWHGKIRSALTDAGAMDVQVNFKDSLHQSISITAAPGIKMAKVSPSKTNTTVQKQVVIDKPDIDTEVEAPDFGNIEIENNTDELLESINQIELAVPQIKTSEPSASTRTHQSVSKPASAQAPSAVSTPAEVTGAERSVEDSKESLRRRYARAKSVDKNISYDNIRSKDDLFIDGSVVLVKRFINQGVILYYWMTESYNPAVHKMIEKGSGKFQKDDSVANPEVDNNNQQEVDEVLAVTDLDFIAVDDDNESQKELRKDYNRNKGVDTKIKASQLKEGDILYVLNQTVLVERPITHNRSAYYWLVGETAIPREVESKGDNRFIVR